MILFAADNHYGSHPGAQINEGLRAHYDIEFFEDDWSCFTDEKLAACDLLVLNMIGDTCNVPHPDANAETAVKKYVEAGRPLLLLHGSSAAFWQWDWWREIVGFRWVRPKCPSGVDASWHPIRPYKVTNSKSAHPLVAKLRPLDLEEDEIYISLEQTSPAMVLQETRTDEGTFPQCYETTTPHGGRILGFLPGHRETSTQHPDVLHNVRVLIDALTSGA